MMPPEMPLGMPPDARGLIGRQLGDYVLEDLLGAGGMAEVYRAWDLTLEREVAVKVLPTALASDPGYIERFRTEARRVGALQHPHIVPVYYFGERPLLYLVMPILAESLRQRLRREGRLDPAEAIRIASEIAAALAAAHQEGFVHRDVKPENILLDTGGIALLSDFGIAREVNFDRQGGAQTISGSGLPVGTPEYMAPEQLRNERVGVRADIYGLGAVLYELLCGVVPHRAETPFEVAARALTAPITPPSQLNPRIWPALERVMLTALALRPEDRYPSASAFAVALAHAARSAGLSPGASSAGVGFAVITRRLPRSPSRSRGAADDPADDLARVATVPRATILRAAARNAGKQERQRKASSGGLLLAGVAMLLVVALCGRGALVAFGGINLLHRGHPTPTLTLTATDTPTPTVTPAPTDTPVPTATPLATPPLTFSPNPAQLIQVSGAQCKGYLYISNGGGQTLGWQWQSSTPDLAASLTWSLNDPTVDQSWPPHDDALPAGQSETLWLAIPCSGQVYSVTAADTLGNSYTLTLQSQ